ncbi:MAG TPA: methionyl-tRNA formyltransferase, partial [Anaerolineaceae bacterium]|nr:methionyl-tRNA formyltransferase [Anaerolineaceae bacterium]
MQPRVIFMGSPDFALPTLQALVDGPYEVVGVVTQPDRPAGRGRVLTPPPVKLLAETLGIPVIQPNRLREPGVFEQLQAWDPDLIVVTAFGQILRANVLDLPRKGCINVHASLLPRWRGAAPIQAAILAGDEQSGATIMRMDPGVDTGPILTQRPEKISPEDTAASLGERLAKSGADLLVETLPAYLDGRIIPQAQDESGATYAPMLKKENGALDFQQSAVQLTRQIRAYYPWPGAYTLWEGLPLKVLKARAVDAPADQPGTTLVWQGMPAVATR